jgi:hypothetical protein
MRYGMKRKISVAIILGVVVLLLSYQYYASNYSDHGILEKVINRNGYILKQVQEPISITLFIKPEWIPFDSDSKLSLNEEVLKIHSTNIILDNVWNRGNDIYFSFRTTYDLNYREGEFVYNGNFNEDGTFTWSSKIDGTILYDKEQTRFTVGQTGSGPESDFSFGIGPENYSTIKDGFYIEYNNFIRYQYVKR